MTKGEDNLRFVERRCSFIWRFLHRSWVPRIVEVEEKTWQAALEAVQSTMPDVDFTAGASFRGSCWRQGSHEYDFRMTMLACW